MNLKDEFIEYRNTLDLPGDITFGIEIEYENIKKDYMDYYIYDLKQNKIIGDWKNKEEIDISEYDSKGNLINGEVTSPILTDNINSWKELKKVVEVIDKNNGIITDRCGTHINIGAQIMGGNSIYWRNFLLLWILYEDEIYKFCSGEFSMVRKRKKTIDPISSSLDISKILDVKEPSANYIYYITDALLDKTHDISLKNVYSYCFNKDNVIEFRLPNGTIKEEIIQNYINFFAKFLIASKKELDIDKILYNIKNNIRDNSLCDYVFEEEIDKQNFLMQASKQNKVYSKKLPSHLHF